MIAVYSILLQWLNSQEIMSHSGGHLPFEAPVNKYLRSGSLNRLTVAVNNTLTPYTLPPGTIEYKNDPNRFASPRSSSDLFLWYEM